MNEQVMLENALREQARKDVVNQIAQEYIANGLAKSLAVRNTRPQFVTASDKSPLAKAAKDAYETALKDRTIKQEAIAFNQQMQEKEFAERQRQFDESQKIAEAKLIAQAEGAGGSSKGNSNLTVEEKQTLQDAKQDRAKLYSLDDFMREMNILASNKGEFSFKDGKISPSGSVNLWKNSQENFRHDASNYVLKNITSKNIETAKGKVSLSELLNTLPKEKQSQVYLKMRDEILRDAEGLPKTNWGTVLKLQGNAEYQHKGKNLTMDEYYQDRLVSMALDILDEDFKTKMILAKKGGGL